MDTSSFNAALYDFSGSRAIGGSKLIVKSCDLLLVLFCLANCESSSRLKWKCVRHAYIILLLQLAAKWKWVIRLYAYIILFKILWTSFCVISPAAFRSPSIYSTCFFSFSDVLPARIDAKLKCSCSTKTFGSTVPLPSISSSVGFHYQ